MQNTTPADSGKCCLLLLIVIIKSPINNKIEKFRFKMSRKLLTVSIHKALNFSHKEIDMNEL